MSTLNLGMQCVDLMRRQGSAKYEEAKKCKSLADLRKAKQSYPAFQEESLDSMAPVKILLADLFQRLELKKKFEVGVAASGSDIEEMWENGKMSQPLIPQ